MNLKINLITCYFSVVSFLGVLIDFNLLNLKLSNLVFYYAFSTTIPFFILQIYSLTRFSRKLKNKNLKLFKKACIRPNGSIGNSINVASLFSETILFSEIKDEVLLAKFRFTKRVVILSMLSFIVLIFLVFI